MRIVKLHLRTYWQPEINEINDTYGLWYYADEAYGMKLNLFRTWVQYTTQSNIEGTNSGTDFSVETPWEIYQYDIPLRASSGDIKYYSLPYPDYGYSEFYDSYPGPDVYIISAHLKAWTRGTTQSCYAEINYDR